MCVAHMFGVIFLCQTKTVLNADFYCCRATSEYQELVHDMKQSVSSSINSLRRNLVEARDAIYATKEVQHLHHNLALAQEQLQKARVSLYSAQTLRDGELCRVKAVEAVEELMQDVEKFVLPCTHNLDKITDALNDVRDAQLLGMYALDWAVADYKV